MRSKSRYGLEIGSMGLGCEGMTGINMTKASSEGESGEEDSNYEGY